MRNKIVGLSVAFIVTACGGGGGGSNSSPTTPTSNKTLPTINVTIDKSTLNVFQSGTLSWNTTDATSCSASGSWSGDIGTSGSRIVSSTKEESLQYNFSCSNSNGSTTKSVTVKVIVPELSLAGAWEPADKASLTNTYKGYLANTFKSLVNMGNGNYGLVVSGWGLQSDTNSTKNPLIHIAFFESNTDGTLKLNTQQYISNTLTNGAGSIIANDFNLDGKDDIVILPLNETPFVARPGVVYFSSVNGFKRVDLTENINVHDSQLVRVNNVTKIVTSTFTENPRNIVYEIIGEKVLAKVPNLINSNKISPEYFNISGMSNTIITNKDGSKRFVSGSACELNLSGGCSSTTINVFGYDGYDITSTVPDQKIIPYLSNTGKFTTLKSLSGTNNTHVYRVWSIDLNHDGNEDILAGTSMWSAGSNTFPSMLQVLLNNGKGALVDKTDQLNSDMSTNSEEMDYSPSFIDIDNSGIKTILLSGSYGTNSDRQANYLLLNDGTGKLYPALHKEFEFFAQKVYDYLYTKNLIDKNYTNTSTFPKFIGIPSSNGSINFVAEIFSNYNKTQTNFYYVNVPLSYNPKTDFVTNVNIADRNNSTKIRTWAGDDTITDKNAVFGTRIDGGLGKNKVTYGSASTNYTVTKNSDGSYRVTSSANNIDDTLVRIHNIVFTDKTITLE